MVWGSGTSNNLGPYWLARMLDDLDVTKKLGRLFDLLPDIGSVLAFQEVMNKGKCGLPKLGMSFATKTLHFFGYDRVSDQPPLILDKVVAAALRDAGCSTFPPYTSNPCWYQAYL